VELIEEYGEMNKLMNANFEEVTMWLASRLPVNEDVMDTT
jgi:hypothetical protein